VPVVVVAATAPFRLRLFVVLAKLQPVPAAVWRPLALVVDEALPAVGAGALLVVAVVGEVPPADALVRLAVA